MKLDLNARTQAIALLLSVATAGALAGAVGTRLLAGNDTGNGAAGAATGTLPAAQAPGGPWQRAQRPAERYVDRLARTLELTADQRAAIDSILRNQQERVQALAREVRPRFQAIARETRAGIDGVLTPEQRARLRSLREERIRTLRPGMREMMRPGPEPGRPLSRVSHD
jgi:Spy/CpxP family protein refolding chaperone